MTSLFTKPWAYWLALLLLCAPYLQGAFGKIRDFPGAVAEMRQFGLSPPAFFAVAVVGLEIMASLMILTAIQQWLGALLLAGFTTLANLWAIRSWAPLPASRKAEVNVFFEHWGLTGGLLLVALYDLGSPA